MTLLSRLRGVATVAFAVAVTFVVTQGLNTSKPPPIEPVAYLPYWTADFEEGPSTDITGYSDQSFVQAEDASVATVANNAVVSSGSGGAPTAHGGSDMAKFTTDSGTCAAKPHSKVFKEWKFPTGSAKTDNFGRALQAAPASGIDGTYRAWFYFPTGYAYTSGCGWTNIFQFKAEQESPYAQDPQWWVNVKDRSGGGANLHVENWSGGTYTDPGGEKQLITGRWFEIRADVFEGDRIDWFLDGAFWQTVPNSATTIGRGSLTGTPRTWIFGVGHYGGIGTVYIDDQTMTPAGC